MLLLQLNSEFEMRLFLSSCLSISLHGYIHTHTHTHSEKAGSFSKSFLEIYRLIAARSVRVTAVSFDSIRNSDKELWAKSIRIVDSSRLTHILPEREKKEKAVSAVVSASSKCVQAFSWLQTRCSLIERIFFPSIWNLIRFILLRETLRLIFNLDPLENKDRFADLSKFLIIDRGKKNSFPFTELGNRRFLRVF